MAKLFFSSANLEPCGCVHATKTEADESYIHNKEGLTVIEVSDSDYDNFFDGTSAIECNGNNVSFVANTIDETQENEEEYKIDIASFKSVLSNAITRKTNHSKKAEAQALVDAEIQAAQAAWDAQTDEEKAEPNNFRPSDITLP